MKERINKNKTIKFKQYAFGLVLAIELIMSFTFLGYIHVQSISATIAYIPIVVAGCLFGPVESTFMGVVFGLGSMYKASALYVVSIDRIFSPLHSSSPVGSILLSVGARAVFGLIIGILFSLVRKKKYIYLWNGLIAAISPLIHSFLVYSVMGVFFSEYGYTYKNSGQIKISDLAGTAICVICVELVYMFYHSATVKKYESAVNYTKSNPHFSKRIGTTLFIVEAVIICMAVMSTTYFSDRSKYMLIEHNVKVTKAISSDLLHLQIQFLIAMLALDLILIIFLLVGYRYMAYREYKGEMDHLTGIMGRRLFLYYCNKSQEEDHAQSDGKGWFLFVDVDWFKQINDTLGHSVGDDTLKQIAQILQNMLGKYGAVGRVGGDEFAAIVDQKMSCQELEEKLEEFLNEIAEILPERKVSCSIGAYRFSFPQDVKHLLEETDAVLYKAKAIGKACFVIQE